MSNCFVCLHNCSSLIKTSKFPYQGVSTSFQNEKKGGGLKLFIELRKQGKHLSAMNAQTKVLFNSLTVTSHRRMGGGGASSPKIT